MKTLFISDLHLEAQCPELTRLFLDFLAHHATQAEALYILGDWFAAWIGDDDRTELSEHISIALQKIAQQGIAIYFMPGNRDFLLGEQYLKTVGACLLTDPTVINLYGTPTLLMHGDTLCTDDKNYQRFRKIVRSPWLQKIFLALPLSVRRFIASHLRKKSRQTQAYVASEISDAKQEEIERVMKLYHVNLLIHGHTHRPAIHSFELNGVTMQRIVLSDWGKMGNMLVCEGNNKRNLEYFNR